MKGIAIAVIALFASFVFARDDLPVWEYPILGSEYIGDNCSEEANHIIMRISFSPNGTVQNIVFVKESSIPEVNQEAKKYMMDESPFMEFDDMTQEEKKRYSVVKISYTILCKNS